MPEFFAEPVSISDEGQPHFLQAYVVSDVHLNNHPYDQAQFEENPRRQNFREFLSRVNLLYNQHDQLYLILNGDILDITGSWFEEMMPWDSPERVEPVVLKVIGQIVQNNTRVFDELNALIEHPNVRIIYIIGNHDGMLGLFPKAQAIVQQAISSNPAHWDRIQFHDAIEIPELKLYVEHGHRFDRYNRGNAWNPHPLGDYINILIVNRFVDEAMEKLRANQYSRNLITTLNQQLHEIEYLRPFSLIPLWIHTVANQYQHHPENEGKRESIPEIILSTAEEVVRAPAITHEVIQKLKIPGPLVRGIVSLIIRFPGSLPVISFLCSLTMRRTHSNNYQYRMAKKLSQEKGYALIAFGHTHIPGVSPLSQSSYFFNTGSWKPILNLFKTLEYDTSLEYLIPNVHFNKIERSGILVIEKNLSESDSAPHFSLQTNQGGLSKLNDQIPA